MTTSAVLQNVEPYLDDEVDGLVDYLNGLYQGAFTPESIRAHLTNYVGFVFCQYTNAVTVPYLPAGARVLDIGCGFGSTVVAAREAGLDAFGVEISAFEVEFARKRLERIRPSDDPEQIFIEGDATRIDIPDESLDAVAFWNVLEHIEDCGAMLDAAWRMLKPGGQAYLVCPNYAASRLEAHYHVPWDPRLRHDRERAAAYLQSLGRDPTYFETSIFCRTNAEVLGVLKRLDFEPLDISDHTSMEIRPGNLLPMLRHPRRFISFHHPQKESVTLVARKRSRRT